MYAEVVGHCGREDVTKDGELHMEESVIHGIGSGTIVVDFDKGIHCQKKKDRVIFMSRSMLSLCLSYYYAPAHREGGNKHCFYPSVRPSICHVRSR